MLSIKSILSRQWQEWFAPPTEIHVERIFETYDKLSNYTKKHPKVMLLLLLRKPPFWDDRIIQEVEEKSSRIISKVDNPIGLHVHLIRYSGEKLALPFDKQYERIKREYEALKALGVEAVDFCSGCWAYDENTLEVCEKLGLTKVHIHTGGFHSLPTSIPERIEIVAVRNSIHDYQL
jgi:hypothetical protein